MTLANHAIAANKAAAQVALAAQDLRDRSMHGIHPTHDELVKLLNMARGVAYHAARTVYAVSCVEQRGQEPVIVPAPDVIPVESEGGHHD